MPAPEQGWSQSQSRGGATATYASPVTIWRARQRLCRINNGSLCIAGACVQACRHVPPDRTDGKRAAALDSSLPTEISLSIAAAGDEKWRDLRRNYVRLMMIFARQLMPEQPNRACQSGFFS